MATSQDSWLFGLGLVLSIACLVWNNESEDALCDRELMRREMCCLSSAVVELFIVKLL